MSQTNFVQVVELTAEEKRKIYSKMKKSELIEMLIACNEFIDSVGQQTSNDYKAKYEKCIKVITKFDAGIIGMYGL